MRQANHNTSFSVKTSARTIHAMCCIQYVHRVDYVSAIYSNQLPHLLQTQTTLFVSVHKNIFVNVSVYRNSKW